MDVASLVTSEETVAKVLERASLEGRVHLGFNSGGNLGKVKVLAARERP